MIENIYEEWLSLRSRIGKRGSSISDKRKQVLSSLLEKHNAEDLIMVLKYIKTANDFYARFMRGDNKKNKDYTNFDSIFRPTKMDDKIEKAHQWEEANQPYSDETFFPFQIVGA
tara:strand:+ start:650 stop:991 length:342 start_codon:yes stop_codon:yes gene_type:complete